MFDLRLARGPIGALALASMFSALAFVTFTGSVPLWLVEENGYSSDAAIIGWTLSAFAFAGGLGSILGGFLAPRLGPVLTIVGALLLTFCPLLAVIASEPGTAIYYGAIALAGILLFVPVPALIIIAQEFVPGAPATASGMVLGLGSALAGSPTSRSGAFRRRSGLTTGILIGFSMVVPSALIGLVVLLRSGTPRRRLAQRRRKRCNLRKCSTTRWGVSVSHHICLHLSRFGRARARATLTGGGKGTIARPSRPLNHPLAGWGECGSAQSFGVLGATAAVQAVIFPGSVALLADLIHNAGDALTAIPVGAAFLLRSDRAEKWAGYAVVLAIFISGCVALYETIERLLHPEELSHLWLLAGAGLIGFLGNELAARIRLHAGERLSSPALVADGKHARVDGFVSLGVIASAFLVGLGWEEGDPVVGLLITLVILKVTWDAWHTVRAR